MRLSDEELNKIRNSADIVEVVGHYIPVIKSGRNYKAICPFHDDSDPSLNISVSKQIYKCFSCTAGGNVFSFVQNYEKVSFIEAVKKVAEISGYPLNISLSDYEKPKDPLKEKYYKVLQEAIKFLKYQLNSFEASKIKYYLTNRGIDGELIDMFDIGYNGDENILYRFLNAKGYNDMDIVSVNLIRSSANGFYDVFGGRITFPIHDIFGNPIGFTARSVEENVAKYINTNETDLYIKGNIVYNYHRAKDEAKRKGKLYVVEGVMDVIAFARAKIYNVVATLGTACTLNQLNEMKKTGCTIIFCYDGDEAGKAANFKAGKLASAHKMDIRIIDNQSGDDPDDIVNKHGVDALVALCKKELSWLEYCFEYYLKKYNLQLYSEKKEFVSKIMEEIALSDDEFDRQNFLHKLTQLTGFKINTLSAGVVKQKKFTKVKFKPALEGIKAAERYILQGMLSDNNAVDIFINRLGFLVDDDAQILAMIIIDEYRKYNEVKVADLLDNIQDEKIKNLLLDISLNANYNIEFDEVKFMSYINRVKKWLLEDETEKLRMQIQEEVDNDNKFKLMLKYRENLIELRRYNNE